MVPTAVELVTVIDTDDTFSKGDAVQGLRRRLLPAAAAFHRGVLLQLRISAADHLAAELISAKVH